MADRETWAKRVAEWRSSGRSSTAYCAGKDFTAGGLRHWAHRLSRGEQQDRPRVRVARVVRVGRTRREARSSPAGDHVPVPEVVVEIGWARIAVRAGFDRATLAAVLDEVLAAAGRCTR